MKTFLVNRSLLSGKFLSAVNLGAISLGIVVGLIIGFIFPQLTGGLSRAQIQRLKSFFPVISEVRIVSGTVKKIDGNTITLEIAQSSNPLDEWPTTRMVTVTDATKIIKRSQETSKESQEELEAYTKAVRAAMENSAKAPPPVLSGPPAQFKEENVSLSDLKVGDVISVEADSNIKSKTRFTAVKITLGAGITAGSGASGTVPIPPVPRP